MQTLTTKRLIIKKAELTDSEFFLKLLNSPNWIEFIGDRGVKTVKGATKYIQDSLISSYHKNGYGLYKVCLKDNGTPIGICGFVKRDYLEDVDIGFAMLSEYEGKGFAYEAAKATIEYGNSQLNLTTILAITTRKNNKSRKLLSKVGFLEIGIIKPDKSSVEFLLFSNKNEKPNGNIMYLKQN
ncbi:GNAT family N-acetyltransferase [Flavobacteriaceae bacterium AU392]|nr:N-acetyltransferase [Flavobacteriaceae bacterium]RKM82853.1 GNAT family N-acetyltransferase [Flavobacteriaceae bacterium AU392]